MTKSPTKYQKILINSNRNSDLQGAVVVAVAGAHTREIWSRLPLEIAVEIEDRCRGWGPLIILLTKDMIVSDHNNPCWGTTVPGHRRVWAQIKCVWAQSCLGPIVYGHKRGGTM